MRIVCKNFIFAEPFGGGSRFADMSSLQRGPLAAKAWRNTLLGGAATGALLLATNNAALADDVCSTASTTLTCTGDQSDGISTAGPSITTLDVLTLTADIRPASGISGIVFTSTNTSITLASDTDDFGIFVTGAAADAIKLDSTSSSVHLVHSGDVTSDSAMGIYAQGHTAVYVKDTGKINSAGDGLHAHSDTNAVTVIQNGDINATAGRGIYAKGNNALSVTGGGDIISSGDGIYARSATNGVTVSRTGDITSSAGRGVYARGNNAISVTVDGTLKSSGDGVFALSSSRDVTVGVTGDLTTTAGSGIYAKGNNAISVTVGGTLKSSGDGVVAQSNSQGVTVKTGNVTSTGGKGIYAKGHNDIYVKAGAVHSSGDAVFADSQTTQVTIKTSGDITSDLGRGLYATGHSNITITSVGKVEAHGDAVFATNDINNGSSINVTQTGDVTSTTGHGIYAAGHASVTLTSTGVVQADDDAVYALSQKSTAGITQGGNVTSTKGYGLYADGWAAVTIGGAGGDVQAKKDGIRAVSSNSSTSITWNGDVSSGTSAAIFTTAHAAITVGSTGDLTSFTNGIYAKNASTATIGITQTGDVTAGRSAINAISSGGEVDVTTDGNLAGDTDGIVLSSTGKLSVTVNGGSVKGATAGVLFSQGSVDSLINHGAIKNSAGIGGDAIVAAADQLTVDNYGTVTGNVRLSSLGNSFANHAGSLFEMGTTVNLGTGNLLTNDGTLSPGGVGSIAATTLTGGLVNNNGGILALDVDWQHGQIDQIAASGGAALDGKVAVNVLSLPTASDAPLAFVTASGGTSVDTLATLNPVLAGDISYPDADHADLTSALDFSPTGLSSGSAKVGDYLNQSYGGGGLSATDPFLLSLANMTSLGSVDAALQQLAPNAYLSAKTEAVYGASAFTDSLMSCKVPDGVAKFSLEGQCVWERADGGSTTITPEDGTGFTAHQRELAAGGQQPLDKDLRLGFAGGVLQTGLTDATGATTTGQTVEAGGVLKYAPGGILLAASLAGSYGRDETIRPAAGTTFIGEGTIATIDARARAAYTFETANWYVKPQADLDVTYVYGGALESGAPAALRLAATGQAVLSATPALEVGGQVDAGDVTLRPYARAGVSLYANQNITGGVSLASDTSGDSFSIAATSDQTLYRLSAGIDMLGSNGMDFRAFYDGVVGASTRSQSGGLKFSYAF